MIFAPCSPSSFQRDCRSGQRTYLKTHGLSPRIRHCSVEPDRRKRVRRLTRQLQLNADARALLAAVEQTYCGALMIESNSEIWAAMELICRLFKDRRCVLVFRNRTEVRSARRRLRKRLGNRVVDSEGFHHNESRRIPVVVLDSQQFGEWNSNPANWPLIVFADGRLALGARAADSLLLLRDARRYCLYQSNTQFHPREQLELEALFGPPIWRQSTASGISAEVQWVSAPVAPLARNADPLTRKRSCIWHHRQRNQLVADIARSISARDRGSLKQLGLRLGKAFFGQYPSGIRIGIFVESAEHARQLNMLLPEWPIFTANDHVPGLRMPKRFIATVSFAQVKQPLPADVMILR